MKQRIIFINLHTDWMLLLTSSVFIYKFSAALKHKYLLDYLLSQPEKFEVINFLNDKSFSIFDKGGEKLQRILSKFSKWENRWILKKNGIDPKKITVITDPNEIKKDDIIIVYNIMDNNFHDLDKLEGFKAVSLLHFHGKAGEDKRIRESGIDLLFNESNLQESSEIFRRYYDLKEMPWLVHPFVFAERFKPIKPFKERKNKAFSVGTITYKTHKEFLDTYGDPCDQPVRKFVKDNPDFFKDTADSYSEDYMEKGDYIEIKPKDLPPMKLYKKIRNKFKGGRQKKYFSFDMVEKFNEYKMHILGEEILGVPGIGYVEGMACGSAYIGLDSPMYRDLGLIPGVHYISYDGTKEGLKDTIEFWQKPENQEKLEKIANAGCEFVRNKFRGEKVAENLLSKIIEHSNIVS